MDELISQLNRAIAAAREEFIYANVVMIDDNIYKTLFPIYKFRSVGEDADGAYVHMELEKACPVICGLKAFASDLKPFLKDTAFALFETKEEENEEPRWISVKDKLPTDMDLDWVLACVVEDNGYKWPIPKVAEYRKSYDDWYIEGVGWLQNNHKGFFCVTHWMPLPELPKEAEA